MQMTDDELILAEREFAARQRPSQPPPPPPVVTPEKPVPVVAAAPRPTPRPTPSTQMLKVKTAPPPMAFEFADEPTKAPRLQRKGAMTKSLKEQQMAGAPKRRWGVLLGVPLVLVVAAAVWFMWPETEVRPGKVIVTP